MMGILGRYMALRFLKPFLFGLGLFALLIFLGDMFDKMPRLVKSPASLWVILQYLWLEVPYWAVRVIPMATLVATLFAVTGFLQSGEWIAVQASGFEARAFFRPILAMAALVTVASFAAQETVLPACYARAQHLWRDRIHPEWEWDKYEDVVLVGGPGRFVTAKTFLVGRGLLENPVMDYYEGGRTMRQVGARRARWDPAAGRWVFLDGVDRSFGEDGQVRERAFSTLSSDLDAPPKALVPRARNPDEMSILETRRYLKQARRTGGSPRTARAALHAKLAYPFANLVLCALGIPIAMRLGRARRVAGFVTALAVSFAYVWMMEMGLALGAADRVHPALAAWTANLTFGTMAAWLYRRTEV